MAELDDVYGNNYQTEAKDSRNNYVLNTIANNLAHRQFNFRLFDSAELWDTSHNLLRHAINTIANKVKVITKQMTIIHIDKHSEGMNMFPELVIDSPVEYFLVIDGEFHRAYFIYITPYEVSAY